MFWIGSRQGHEGPRDYYPEITRRERTSFLDSHRAPSEIVRKWGLHFKDNKHHYAEEFLVRLEEKRQVSSLTDMEILDALPELLSGRARDWYRLSHREWQAWEDFTEGFRERFNGPNYQRMLKEEVTYRIQQTGESMADFVDAMRSLMTHIVPPWSQSQQLDAVIGNIHPRYLSQIRAFKELVALGTDLETGWALSRKHRELASREDRHGRWSDKDRERPRRRERSSSSEEWSEGSPDRDRRMPPPREGRSAGRRERSPSPAGRRAERRPYREEYSRSEEGRKGSGRKDVAAVDREDNRSAAYPTGRDSRKESGKAATRTRAPTPAAPRRRGEEEEPSRPVRGRQDGQPSPGPREDRGEVSGLTCWNCGKIGHRHGDCTAPRRRFCFRCGLPRVWVESCTRCNRDGAGNDRRRAQ
ncbi:uncharacterized protein LOC107271398 [Cephus cinctus]|uniref:Uncharacterized protein LOC107271398 n=1 Tax=Cephus cinctus TaxID=211228 RepID=A0AAJ7C741_CEPCN|nr:uncharacterized protein LOC107271398 [Cephus cinctus]